MTEQGIIQGILSGGKPAEEAYKLIISTTREKILIYLVARGCSAEDAIDIFQEGLYRLHESIRQEKYPLRANPIKYIWGIWINLLRDWRTGKIYNGGNYEIVAVNIPANDLPSFPLTINEIEEIKHLIDRVWEPECKELWRQKEIEGFSYKEIGQIFQIGLDEHTLRKRMERCKKKLFKNLSKDFLSNGSGSKLLLKLMEDEFLEQALLKYETVFSKLWALAMGELRGKTKETVQNMIEGNEQLEKIVSYLRQKGRVIEPVFITEIPLQETLAKILREDNEVCERVVSQILLPQLLSFPDNRRSPSQLKIRIYSKSRIGFINQYVYRDR